jgi:nitrogen regulatory protein P-II 1
MAIQLIINKELGSAKTENFIQGSFIIEELTDYSPKVRVEMVLPDDLVEGALQILVEVGHTGQVGDGIVWVTPVERMIRLSEQIIVHECD